MKIKQLFDELKTLSENKENIFTESGIVNCFDRIEYGFFPIGLGVLSEESIKSKDDSIDEGGIMVLGNDFGTVSYVNNIKYTKGSLEERGETNSKTIINLRDRFGLKFENIFFTNFYLGIRRNDGRYEGTTMTKRIFDKKVNRLQSGYKKLCYEFFLTQLRLVNPRIIICLGHDVKNALIDAKLLSKIKKSDSIQKLYAQTIHKHVVEDNELGKRTFIIIPHPCDNRNFNQTYADELFKELQIGN